MRVDWLGCWDDLRVKLSGSARTWTQAEILAEMDSIEGRRMREAQEEKERARCTCKGFYKPVDCPVHGYVARGL